MAALAGAGLVVGALATVRIVDMAADLRAAEGLIDTATEALRDGELDAAAASLRQAQDRVFEANESLRAPSAVRLVGWLPGIRPNIQSLEASIDLTATVIDGGLDILEASRPLESPDGTLEVSLSDGSFPLSTVSAVQEEIGALVLRLSGPPPGPSSAFVVPPVRQAQAAISAEVAERRAQLKSLELGLDLLAHLAGRDGPRRYLLAVANTAEMRGSGGMILNYGILEGADGTLDLTEFGRVDEVAPRAPAPSSVVPADYLARWNGFDPLLRWRQANLAADFTVVAPVLTSLYETATGAPVDGVIQIDPQGLAALLDGVGPVEVPPLGQVTGDNVVALTLHEAYLAFPGVEARSDVLGDVAEAAFRKLVDGEVASLRTLARRLAEAVEGRHVLVHDPTAPVRRSLEAFGADGALPALDGEDSLALTVQNLSGNKLDYFLDSSLVVTGRRPAGQLGALEATVTLRNTAPAGVTTPRYVFGPGPGPTATPAGVQRSTVTLYLPAGTTVEGAGGAALIEPLSSGTEAGRPYAAFTVDVPAGEERTVRLALRLAPRPAGEYALVVAPSPRVRPTVVALDIDAGPDRVAGMVALDRAWRFVAGAEPAPVRPAALGGSTG